MRPISPTVDLLARKKPLDIPVFNDALQAPKGRLPSIMIILIAILLLAALGGVFIMYQSAKFPDTSSLNFMPANQQQAPAAPPQPAIECSSSGRQNCTLEGCPGMKTCYGGRYGNCIVPRKICVPGAKIGCSTDACKFGYATCNPCGTGYGACLPRPIYNATNSSPNCTDAACQ